MTYARIRWVAILWIAAIVIGSLSPLEVKEAVGTESERSAPLAVRRRASTIHDVLHYVAFTGGALLLSGVGRSRRERILLCFELIALGCTLELMQYKFLGGPTLETDDMRNDAIAVVLGWTAASITRFGEPARRAAGVETGK